MWSPTDLSLQSNFDSKEHSQSGELNCFFSPHVSDLRRLSKSQAAPRETACRISQKDASDWGNSGNKNQEASPPSDLLIYCLSPKQQKTWRLSLFPEHCS